MANIESEPIVRLIDIGMSFNAPDGTVTPVLGDVNIEIPRGSFTIVHGPSGSGKSTMMNVLVGLQIPTAGKAIVCGTDLYAVRDDARALFRAQHLGLMFQTNYWLASLSILENVAMPLILAGQRRGQARRTAREAIRSIGLSKYEDYMPNVLSVGQQQRFSMLRAMVSSPELLVADEPTGNLDSANGDLIMNLLSEIHAGGTTIVLVTHNPEYLEWGTHSITVRDGHASQEVVAAPLGVRQ